MAEKAKVGLFTVNGKSYKVAKRYIYYGLGDGCISESDDIDLPRDKWDRCEVVTDVVGAWDNDRCYGF